MDKMLSKKVKDNYAYFGGISFIYGIFFTFCLYDNFSGIMFPVCVAVTIVVYRLFLKKAGLGVKKGSSKYAAGIMLIAVSSSYTSNVLFIFFNVVAVLLLFIVLMMHQFYDDRRWDIPVYAENMFLTTGGLLVNILTPFTEGYHVLQKGRIKNERREKRMKGILTGLMISVPVLIIVLPLLLSSDLIFMNLFRNLFSVHDLARINLGTPFYILMFFFTGFVCCYSYFYGLCSFSLRTEKKEKINAEPVAGITLNLILAILYTSYCAVQIVYLFAGAENGLPKGVTYAEYARSGFFELLFVSFINFLLVLICNSVFEENKLLKILLFIISGCTFIMIGSSAYRMILYIRQYHLTFLRILVLWFLIVEALFMSGLIFSISKNNFPLFRFLVLTLMCCYLVLVYIRPETVAARYNLSRENVSAEDIVYLIDGMSVDEVPELVRFAGSGKKMPDDAEWVWVKENLDSHLENILENSENSFRKANFSNIAAKKASARYFYASGK